MTRRDILEGLSQQFENYWIEEGDPHRLDDLYIEAMNKLHVDSRRKVDALIERYRGRPLPSKESVRSARVEAEPLPEDKEYLDRMIAKTIDPQKRAFFERLRSLRNHTE